MNKVTFFKTASLFFFLLTAQFSYGQLICSDYPDWYQTTWYNSDVVHYNGKLYSPCYSSTVADLTIASNRTETTDSCFTFWGFVGDCSTGPAPTELFYEIFNDGQNATNGTDAYGTNWDTDEQSSDPKNFKVKSNKFEAEETDGEAILFTDPIDVGNYTDLKLSSFIEFNGSMESSDFIKFQYKLDGGVLTDVPNAAYYGTNSDNTYQWPLTGITGSTLEIYITFDTDEDEEHKIDNLKLTGVLDCSSASSEVTAAAANASNTQATVTWLNPSANCITINEVLVVAKQGSDFSSATPGGSYTSSTTFGAGAAFDGGFVIYSNGTAQSATVTGLTDGAIYYFKIFTKTVSTWSSGVSVSAVCKENLFFEDFEDEADGATTGTAQGAVNWSSSVSNSEEVDYIGVFTWEGDKEFYIEMKKDDEYAYWTTDAIDISDYEDVNFSLDVGEYGGIDSDHYIETEYSTDNGSSWNTASNNGYLNDDLGDDGVDNQVSQDGINASSLKIRIKVVNEDEHFFDDILVQGQLKLPGCATTNISPTDTATNVSVTPTLSWDAVSGATGYKVYYGTDSSTSTSLGETSSTSQILPTLVNNTQYFWKVVPTNARGDASGCSAISFTTVPLAPGCASYTSPTDGALDVSVTPQLSWSTATGATGYKVYYGLDSGTSTPIPLENCKYICYHYHN